jgi:MFS family permease
MSEVDAQQESAFMATEALSAPLYAPLADGIGRRPVLLGCLVFWGIFAAGFGLVANVMAAIVMRGARMFPSVSVEFPALRLCWPTKKSGGGSQHTLMSSTVGLLAGAAVITRTMCGELCDKTNRIKGFAFVSPAITIGITFG